MTCVEKNLVLGPAVVECSVIDGVQERRRVFEDSKKEGSFWGRSSEAGPYVATPWWRLERQRLELRGEEEKRVVSPTWRQFNMSSRGNSCR